jgi:hypothetical protein
MTDIAEAKRRVTGEWDRNRATIDNFLNADRYLDSLNIGRDARILVMDSPSPNIPFILMDRKGYAVMSPDRENIKNAINWEYDYLVLQNNFFITETFAEYPEILSRIERIAGNGRITVCRLLKKEKQQDLFTFFGLNDQQPVFQSAMDFDSLADTHWARIHPSEDRAHSGTCSGCLTPDDEFGLTYKTGDLNELRDKARLLVCSAWFLHDTIRDCGIVASLNVNGTNIYYKSYNLKDLLNKKNQWEEINLYYQLPRVESGFYEFALYIWNNGRNRLYYDDFGFSVY